MNILPIRTEADYKATLARIEMLMDAGLDRPQGDKLDMLTTLVESYEAEQFPVPTIDPVEAIRFRMEQLLTTDKFSQNIGVYDFASYYLVIRHRHSP